MSEHSNDHWSFTDNDGSTSPSGEPIWVDVQSQDHLRCLLEAAAKGTPRLAILKAPTGAVLFLGVSETLAALCFFSHPKDRSVSAKPKTTYSTETMYFLGEGVPTGFAGDKLMPLAEAIRIACDILQGHEFPDSVDWIPD